LTELTEALSNFKLHYGQFVAENNQYILIEDDLQSAFQIASANDDIKKSAKLFNEGVAVTLRAVGNKKKVSVSKWTSKVGNFLEKLYPVARLSFDLTARVAEVIHISNVLTSRVRLLFL
jgi:hypothetical protein